MSRILRRLGLVALAVLALAGLAVGGAARTSAELAQRPPATAPPTATEHGSGRLVVAVVLGATGTIGTDAMGPYEVFARSSAFTVYTVAAHHDVSPVQGGPGIVPVHTFDEVADGVAPPPDLVVVPALEHPTSPDEQPVRDFVLQRARAGTRILSVCNGAHVLAETGILDGRTATAHWSRLGQLRSSYAAVTWVAGRRYVDDGPVTTTAGMASGVSGALHLVEELAGHAEAVRVAREVGRPAWERTRIAAQRFGPGEAPGLVSALVPWGRPTVGIELRDGVGELDVAAAFEVHTLTHDARTVALAEHDWATTRHGLVLARTAAAPAVDTRVVLPTSRPGPGFAGALDALAHTSGTVTARSAAKLLDQPYDAPPGAPFRWWSARGPVLALAALLAPIALGLAARRTRTRGDGNGGGRAVTDLRELRERADEQRGAGRAPRAVP